MHVLSVSKSYKHRGGSHVHRPGTENHWMVYYVYYNTDEGQFASKRISPLMAAYYKSKREKYLNMVCTICYSAFTIYYKNSKELEGEKCPACGAVYCADNKEKDDDD